MCIICVLLIFVFMMINSKKLIFNVFSSRTASIILLSVPIIGFTQSILIKCIEAENFFAVVRVDDLTTFIIACACISGLIGIELKKWSLIMPALLAIWILIFAGLVTCIVNTIFFFDFNKCQFSTRQASVNFHYAAIVGLLTFYAGQIIHPYFLDLLGEDQPPKSTQTSKSKPSPEAPIINV